jgi:hypothetical protein
MTESGDESRNESHSNQISGAKPTSRPDLYKSVAGLVATLGVIWTFVTGVLSWYEARLDKLREAEQAETLAIAEMSSKIGLVRYNCADTFGALVSISNDDRRADPQKQVCYDAFFDLSEQYYPAALSITAPSGSGSVSSGAQSWDSAWSKLGDALLRSATYQYDRSAIVCAWGEILDMKNLSLPSLVNDSCE